MGWEQRELRVIGHVSRHNNHRDKIDDILWEELVRKVRRVIVEAEKSGEFTTLNLMCEGLEVDE